MAEVRVNQIRTKLPTMTRATAEHRTVARPQVQDQPKVKVGAKRRVVFNKNG